MSQENNEQPRGRRVVQVCLAYHPETGGSAMAVKQFASVFGGPIINFTDRDAEPESASVTTIRVNKTFLGRKFSWAGGPELEDARKILEGADLIICHTLFRYHIQWAGGIAFRNQIPFWVVLHGSLDPFVFQVRSLQKEIWMRLAGNAILSKADAVVCATAREKQKAERRGIPMKSRVVFWSTGHAESTRPNGRRTEIREQLGIKASDRVLLFLARLHEIKRPFETIKAVQLAGASNVHLVMVGGNETVTADECRKYASGLKMANVHVIGPVFDDRKWDYFAAADGYISLSLKENFGFTVAEALIAARPVILSPGIDLITDLAGVNCGWVLPSGNPEVAARAIQEFAAASPEELQRAGERGQKWAQANLNFDRFESRLNELFEQTVAR
ncbi:MAG: glycosyltransferase family 4 protein [Acidobacteriota bacterium]|nr:glycosyltransferase family 4 protein [Acidobacteriota bacterium]